MTRKFGHAIAASAWLAVVLGGPFGLAYGADPAAAELPGVTAPDTMPNGCVSCHTGKTNLKAMLSALRHRDMGGEVKMVPDDCRSCHSEDKGLESMAMIGHSMHYASGSSSEFVSRYGGNCLHCHAMATGTGAVTVKKGPKNW